jgi:hypothetical protein
MQKQFYERILPSQGIYCTASIRDGVIKHFFSDSIDKLLADVARLKTSNTNVYVSPLSFSGHSRTADSAIYSRSLFIDLDVGDSKGKYESKKAAREALDKFLADVGLPAPVLVDSGTGIQAYWPLQDDVAVDAWRACAKKLKELCLSKGLKIDPTVTADAARLMRCPDTYNYKTDPPSPTSVLQKELYSYDFNEVKEFLRPEELTSNILKDNIFDGIERGLDEDTAKIGENFKSSFSDLVMSSITDAGCAQIKNIVLNQKDISYSLWTAGLSVASHCSDAETAIHDMSNEHPGYNREATIAKAEEWLGPRTCEWFQGENPAGCEGCKFRGKIKSPIELSRQLQEIPHQDEPELEDPDKPLVLPTHLKPFSRGEKGGIFYTPPPKRNKDGEMEQDETILVLNHDFYPIKRVVGGPSGETLIIRHKKPKDAAEEFPLPLQRVAVPADLTKVLAEHGEIMYSPKHAQLVMQYLKKWTEYYQMKEAAEEMRMQMGWTPVRDAFVIGMMEITRRGEERKIAASPMVRNVSRMLDRTGSYDVWKNNVNEFFNEPGTELHAMGFSAAFGSPLMILTGTPGCTLGFVSTNSGVGKSALLYAGLSVFGDPAALNIATEHGATLNGIRGRFLGLKNIMLGIDEVGTIDKRDLGRLIHDISQGKAKIRMHSSENRERDIEMSAALQCIVTANTDLNDTLHSLKDSPDGELARYIQFMLTKPPRMEIDDKWSENLIDPLKFNYGWAGPEYIKCVMKLGEEAIHLRLKKWNNRLSDEFSNNTAYRFHRNALAADFAGAEIAIEAGIISYDLERVYKAVLIEINASRRAGNILNATDYKAMLSEFYFKNIDRFLILSGGRVTTEPRGELVGRIEEDEGMYIAKGPLKKFLADKTISEREFTTHMTSIGQLRNPNKKIRLSSGWKAGTGSVPPVYAYEFVSELKQELEANGPDA